MDVGPSEAAGSGIRPAQFSPGGLQPVITPDLDFRCLNFKSGAGDQKVLFRETQRP